MFQHIAKFAFYFTIEASHNLRRPPQSNCPPETVKRPDSRIAIRILASPEWSLTDGSSPPGRELSTPPT